MFVKIYGMILAFIFFKLCRYNHSSATIDSNKEKIHMKPAEEYAALNEKPNHDNIGLSTDGYSATSVIGPEGGVLRVTDTQSTIFGTCLRVPAGAIDTPVRISIIAGDHACSFGLAPSINLLPSGLRFKRSATLKVCLSNPCVIGQNDLKTAEPALFHYDETTDQWAYDDAVRMDWQGGVVRCDLLHL